MEKEWRILARRQRIRRVLAATALAGTAGAALVLFQLRSSQQPAVAQSDLHPCQYVGVWTSARDNAVFRVTLKETGEFLVESIARGPYANASIRDRWEVHGGTMEWKTPEDKPDDPLDINQIRDVSSTGFTLIEVNGTLTRFNLIEPLNSSTCKR